jgi:hypothetical protein
LPAIYIPKELQNGGILEAQSVTDDWWPTVLCSFRKKFAKRMEDPQKISYGN